MSSGIVMCEEKLCKKKICGLTPEEWTTCKTRIDAGGCKKDKLNPLEQKEAELKKTMAEVERLKEAIAKSQSELTQQKADASKKDVKK